MVICIVGPTGVGKTKLSIKLAKKLNGEIINADSTQVFKSLDIATAIGKRIRHINGGFRFVKAMGVDLADRGIVQVSINMTDYTRTSLYRVFETVKFEAARWGVTIAGSEIVGLVPMAALVDTAEYYLGIEDFSMKQVLESRIMEE